MKALRRREFTEGGVRKVEEYLVRIEGRDVAVDEVLNNLTKFDLEQLRVAPIVKVVREMTVKLEAPQNVIEVKDGGPVTIEVYVTRIGPYTGEVLLRPSAGKVEKEKLVIDDAFTTERIRWTVEVPSEEGQYQYTLEVVDPQGVTLDVANAFIKVSKGVGVGWVERIRLQHLFCRDRLCPEDPLVIFVGTVKHVRDVPSPPSVHLFEQPSS
jgi:hypothetical protein